MFVAQASRRAGVEAEAEPPWYKDAIIYEVHVRAFSDANGDGIGDFPGLTEKLGYLQDLGVTALWVLPFCPSPWRDDGYDISDYTNVHPAYGTLRDFEAFLREAHRRGLRVITELVLNHTSDQHLWFQRSRRAAPNSRWRNYYVWSDTPEKYADARIIFKDFEASNWSWDPVAHAYYWHRFYAHQPDLNFDNPEVRAAMFKAVDFWLEMGVDGLRLDAVPYLYEREGTNCENLPETHAFLKELRAHVDARYRDRMILAEANQWPEDAIAYFGSGDECHMAFHFPLMPRLFMATRMEDRYPITEIFDLTPQIPETCQWALFLRNHDELTLEMVTDEERDYMYRVYAQQSKMRINLGIRRRLAPLLENDRRRVELLNALVLSLPGTPVIYYGDEIGMGDNFYLGDRNGVRTPMQWSGDRNAGFSRANPQQLYLPVIIDPEYHYEAVNVETQRNNPHSLLWWMRRLITQRKQSKAFGSGSLEVLNPDNRCVLSFLRRYGNETVLVVANLSRFAQCVELPLAAAAGLAPVEMFGGNEFPPITEQPYTLSLGAHSFYWFQLRKRESQEALQAAQGEQTAPVFGVPSWENVFAAPMRRALARYLPYFLKGRRWFLGKRFRMRFAEIQEIIAFPESSSYLLFLRVEYSDADAEVYLLPLSLALAERAEQVMKEMPEYVLCRLETPDQGKGVLYSALRHSEFCQQLLRAVARRRRYAGESGELVASHTRAFRSLFGKDHAHEPLEFSVARGEHNNTPVLFDELFVLKLIRRLEPGIHPGREMGEFLTRHGAGINVPPLAGALEYRSSDGARTTVAVVQGYVRNEATAWRYTLDNLGLFYEHALALGADRVPQPMRRPLLELAGEPAPDLARELMDSYLEMAGLLGRRVAELHTALASRPDEPDFAPEPYTDFYRHGLHHGLVRHTRRTLDELRRQMPSLGKEACGECERLLASEGELRERLSAVRDRRLDAVRIRIHGDCILTQVLFTGKDFVLIDFEGHPERPMSERRIKRSPLLDVASMLGSLHQAAHAVLLGQVSGATAPQHADAGTLERWAGAWSVWAGAAFLKGYLGVAGVAALLPASREERRVLLDTFLIQQALDEIDAALERRPAWIRVPVRGLIWLLENK